MSSSEAVRQPMVSLDSVLQCYKMTFMMAACCLVLLPYLLCSRQGLSRPSQMELSLLYSWMIWPPLASEKVAGPTPAVQMFQTMSRGKAESQGINTEQEVGCDRRGDIIRRVFNNKYIKII